MLKYQFFPSSQSEPWFSATNLFSQFLIGQFILKCTFMTDTGKINDFTSDFMFLIVYVQEEWRLYVSFNIQC